MSYLYSKACTSLNRRHGQQGAGQLPPDCLSPLLSSFGIDYVTYAQYGEDSVQWYTSNLPYLKLYLADSESHWPVDIVDSTTLLPWASYCSDFFLERCQGALDYHYNGVAVFLRHENYAEHISVGSSQTECNLQQLLYTRPDIKRQIVSHIRCAINLNQGDFAPYVFCKQNLALKKKSVDFSNAADDSLIATKRHFIVGNGGGTYLTPSEMKCLRLYLQLCSAKEIADRFHFSVKTAEAHLANIKRKCGAKSKHELFLIASNNLLV